MNYWKGQAFSCSYFKIFNKILKSLSLMLELVNVVNQNDMSQKKVHAVCDLQLLFTSSTKTADNASLCWCLKAVYVGCEITASLQFGGGCMWEGCVIFCVCVWALSDCYTRLQEYWFLGVCPELSQTKRQSELVYYTPRLQQTADCTFVFVLTRETPLPFKWSLV